MKAKTIIECVLGAMLGMVIGTTITLLVWVIVTMNTAVVYQYRVIHIKPPEQNP